MKIKNIFRSNGRFCAELENGLYMLQNGQSNLMIGSKLPNGGFAIFNTGIISTAVVMRNEEDFRWVVETYKENNFNNRVKL